MRTTILRAISTSEKVHVRIRKAFSYKKVAFLHIPKCGGTSIASSIAAAIGADRSGYIDPIRTRGLAQMCLEDCRRPEGSEHLFAIRRALFFDYFKEGKPYIYGHFPIVRECLVNSEGYEFVTLLREPTQRFVSQFKYYLATKALPNEKFITQERIEDLWQEYFCSDVANFHANVLTAYLDESSFLRLGHSDSAARAIENLKSFSVVGTLENLDLFTQKFRATVNAPLVIRSVKNKTSDKVAKSQNILLDRLFTPDKMEDIYNICYRDINVYNFAQSC